MADFDPDAYLSGGDGSSAAFDPDAYLGNTKPSLVEAATKPITDIPSVYSDTVNQSVSQMGRGVGQLESGDPWTMTKGAGNVALGGLGYVTAPINAPLQSIVGNPVRDAASYAGLSPTASQLAGNLATAGAGFFLPLPGAGTLARTAKLPEVDPAFGLPLTAGEAAQSPAMVRAEQQAIRQGKQYAADFSADRTQRLGDVQEQVTGGMGPSGWKPPATPQQAGETVSARVQQAAATKKAAVTEYYNVAKAFPGEIDAGVFQGMPQGIKTDLFNADEPVVIDSASTPNAAKMIDYLDQKIAALNIPNKVAPPIPAADQVVGVNLSGVDQWRKALSKMRGDSSTPADGRASRAVIDAFDSRIDDAVNNGQFNGNPAAIGAWNNARAAYSDYRSTFGAQRGDPVGNVVQKIIGKYNNEPLPPNAVIDQIVGGSGLVDNALQVGVANRLKGILGDSSPQWADAKAGIFQRLTQNPEGMTTKGTGIQANNLDKFLAGDTAKVIYSPQELQTLRDYSTMLRRITPDTKGFSPSGPSIGDLAQNVAQKVAGGVGAMIAHYTMGGHLPVGSELAGWWIGQKAERVAASQFDPVRKQFPQIAAATQRYSRAQSAAATTPQNPMLQHAAVGALVNLQRTLAPLGVKIDDLVGQGPGPTQAQPNQQQTPGSPSQQNNGGRINQQRPFAKGGAVKDTKSKVHYRLGSKNTKCELCTMFRKPNSCVAVSGFIAKGALCDLFERKQ